MSKLFLHHGSFPNKFFNFFKNRLGIFYNPKSFKWVIEMWFLIKILNLVKDNLKAFDTALESAF